MHCPIEHVHAVKSAMFLIMCMDSTAVKMSPLRCFVHVPVHLVWRVNGIPLELKAV